MTAASRCVLVYNPVSNHGHLDSWNALFVALLLSRGWNVLALTPDVEALHSRLRQKGVDGDARLQVLDWSAWTVQSRLHRVLARAWQFWRALGDCYCYRRPGSKATKDMSFGRYWRKRLFQVIVPPLYRVSLFFYTLYRRARTGNGAGATQAGIEPDPERYLADPADMARRVHAALKKARWKPDIAFNMYMDMYRTRAPEWQAFDSGNALPWAGIRFVPRPAPSEAWYTLAAWRGMCFLDESVCRTYAAALPRLRFDYLPDITETSMPQEPSDLVLEIRRRAVGRRVVFLGGSIGGQKNLALWCQVIEGADPARWFFVQIGEIHRDTLTADDKSALDRMIAAPPENFLLHDAYLPDERAFNDIIAASDLIFAVYRDFQISSNMPGKAASFRKPILVSDRYLLGERVLHYGIGRAVPEDDATAMLMAMDALAADPVPDCNFVNYCHDFSVEALSTRLEQFLTNCLSGGIS